ncbi:DUF3157 family protein [Sessilibacter sp. MAH2]
MKKTITLALLSSVMMAANADETLVGSNGRKVILKDDGSWEYASESIFVDTKSGRRAELKVDGSWEFVGLAPVQEDTQYRELDIDVSVVSADIEEYLEKVGSGKNTRREAYTNFHLDVTVAQTSDLKLVVSEFNQDGIRIRDNKGKIYPVIAIESESSQLKAGDTARLLVKAKGAPGGLVKTKYLRINIDEDVFKTEQPIELEIEYDDLDISRTRK